MRLKIQQLFAVGLVALLTGSVMAQAPAGQAAPRGTGPYGGANAVQPGAGANLVNPTGQPTVPRAGANPRGSGPYGGANAVLPQRPASPTGPTAPTVNAIGNATGAGPYGGFNAALPPTLVPAAPAVPSPAFPGAGVPLLIVPRTSLNAGVFPGQTAVNGVATLPGVPTPTPGAATSPRAAVNPVFTRFFTGLNAVVTPTQPTVVPAP